MSQTEAQRDSRRIVVELTMTVEEARQVNWYRRGVWESFGRLLDTKQINERDLAYAVAQGNTPEVRASALTLLAHWLGQPATLEATKRYGPEVLEGSHYLEDKELESLWVSGFTVGAFLLAVVMLVIQLLILALGHKASMFVIGLNVVAGIAFFSAFFYRIRRSISDYVSFRRGREGEDRVVEGLRTALDHSWTVFRNLRLPDRKDDLDIVLVGPGGVWVIEVKAYRGTLRFRNGKWERQTKTGWANLRENPSSQVTGNAKRLNDYLKRQGLVRWVERAVALAEAQPVSNFEANEIPIWLPPTIEDHVAKLATRTPPTEKELEQITALLKSLAERQIAREEA